MAVLAALTAPVAAHAQSATYSFDIPAQDLGSALRAFGRQAHQQIVFDGAAVRGKTSAGLKGTMSADEALKALLGGSGLHTERTATGVATIVSDQRPTTAAAPAAVPEAAQVSELTVTGSNIRGNDAVGARVEIGQEAIRKLGVGSVPDLLRFVPQNFAGGTSELFKTGSSPSADSTFVNNDQSTAVNLRGLGVGDTLVLVNGRRVAPSDAGQFVDVGAIPLAAIDRVEFLTDGASAIYGSDAIAGVANFILKDHYDGAETSVRYGHVTSGGYDQTLVSQLLGHDWTQGNAMAVLQYSKSGPLFARERHLTSNLPADVQLIAPLQSTSLYLTGNEQIFSSVKLFVDGMYTRRTSQSRSPDQIFQNTIDDDVSRAERFGGTIGLDFELPAQWRSEVSADLWRSTTRFDHAAPPFLPSTVRAASDFSELQIKADGPLLQLPGGGMRGAVGASLTHDRTRDLLTSAGLSLAPTTLGSRNDRSFFVETLIPLIGESNSISGVQRLELDVAARYDNYSDFGSTTNPKYSLLWVPMESLELHASFGRSFKAPTLEDLTIPPGAALFAFPDPTIHAQGNTIILLKSGAAPLRPETAKTWTIGADWRPSFVRGFSASLYFYNIDFRNRIASPPAFPIMISEPAVFASLINRSPTQAQIAAVIASAGGVLENVCGCSPDSSEEIIDIRFQNQSRSLLRGLDFSVSYAWDTRFGQFTALGVGNYNIRQQNFVLATAPPDNNLDRSYAPPRWAGRASLVWSQGPQSVSISANAKASYDDIFSVVRGFGPHKVERSITYDLNYELDASGLAPSLRGLRASFTVQNLFDEEPPRVLSRLPGLFEDFDAANADIRGRFVSVQITKSW